MQIKFNRLNHIQICIPKGEEASALQFYCGILGLDEVKKPDILKSNGGFWLEINNIQIHIGTEELQGISKRHFAFEVQELEKCEYTLWNTV